MQILRSPLFYVGDKYKLMTQLKSLFPVKIDSFIEPFVGGGSVFLNTVANKYVLNDLNKNIIELHEFLISTDRDDFFNNSFKVIEKFGLSCSFLGKTVDENLKKKYIKTYYAHFNKSAYIALRDEFNNNQSNKLLLYILLIYGFNHMIRFNFKGEFNLPVGNVDFNKNVYSALNGYFDTTSDKNISLFSINYTDFLNKIKFKKNDFIYFDPPYLISNSEYNKKWQEEDDILLYKTIDKLHNKGIRFGITNLINHKGKINTIFHDWCKKYRIYNIKSNYISFNDNTIKNDSKELYVTNYIKEN